MPVSMDFDADAVIVAGVNGSGKTSLFDAILWALSGSIGRLDDDASVVVSRYSPSGEARVEVVLRSASEQAATVVRRFDGAMHLSVQYGSNAPVSGVTAEAALIDLLWPDAKSATDQMKALTRSLTRATYLQQDAVREFVEADSEQTRFDVVSELVGAGRIGELQRQLESSKNSWTRATTGLSKELEPLLKDRQTLAARLARLGTGPEVQNIDTQFASWQTRVANVLEEHAGQPGRADASVQGLEAQERLLGDLLAREQTQGRSIATLRRLVAHLEAPVAVPPNLESFQEQLAVAETSAREIADRLSTAEEQAAEGRRLQVARAQREESMATLAQLALENLGEECPVCGQDYERDVTRSRLEQLVALAGSPSPEPAVGPNVSAIATELAAAESAVSSARRALRDARALAQQGIEWRQGLLTLLQDAGLGDGTTLAGANEVLSEAEASLATLRELRSEGERLSLGVARASEMSQRHEVEKQLEATNAALAARSAAIDARAATGELAGQVIAALRTASSSVVTRRLHRIEPLLQRIFATVDPHPSLRVVGFLTKTVRGHGQLWTTLDDTPGEVRVQDPAHVLSSSQMNVLAVAIFLSLNLAIPTLPLQVVALDDPLQSLDTVNLLGLADLLRRVKASRQVIVSTHDERLADLLERKLRPVAPGERTIRIDLRGWTSQGPTADSREVPRDVHPLRLVESA